MVLLDVGVRGILPRKVPDRRRPPRRLTGAGNVMCQTVGPHDALCECRRPSPGDLGLQPRAPGEQHPRRVDASHDGDPLAGRGSRGRRRGRQLQRRRPAHVPGKRNGTAAGRPPHAGQFLATPRLAPALRRAARHADGPAVPALGLRERGTGSGAAAGTPLPGRSAGAQCRLGHVRGLDGIGQAGQRRARPPAPGALPGDGFQAGSLRELDPRAHRRVGADRRGAHGRPQGTVPGLFPGSPGRRRAVSLVRRAVARRMARGPGAERPDAAGAGALQGPDHLGRQPALAGRPAPAAVRAALHQHQTVALRLALRADACL